MRETCFGTAAIAGTSLDALGEAMAMNRPSLYSAFGDKHALYLSTLDRYVELGLQTMEAALAGDRPLADALLSGLRRRIGDLFACGRNTSRLFPDRHGIDRIENGSGSSRQARSGLENVRRRV